MSRLRIPAGRSLAVAAFFSAFILTAAPAHAADYRLWYAHAQDKVYRSSLPPSYATSATTAPSSLSVTAARSEHEGKQIIVRTQDTGIKNFWMQPSDLVCTDASGTVIATIGADKVETFKVTYVYISRPSTGYGRRGQQPDPLIPMTLENGERLGWLPDGSYSDEYRKTDAWLTQPYYVLFKVPDDAIPGIYRGTLTLTAEGADGSAVPPVAIPVELQVYSFSVARRTIKTSFGIGLNWARYANSPGHNWLPIDTTPAKDRVSEHDFFQYDQISRWYEYLDEHRLSPQTSLPAWYRKYGAPGSNGVMTARQAYLKDYLSDSASSVRPGKDGFGFNSIRMPEMQYRPAFVTNPFLSYTYRMQTASYLASMRNQIGEQNLWKTYAYPIDEPPVTYRSRIEGYASLVHKYAPGVRFLLTTDGNKWGYRPLRGVDIYVQRLQYYYMNYSAWVWPLRSSGKEVWIYSHATPLQAQVPMYLLDKPLGEVRAMGYFAYHTSSTGLLYYNVNRWCMSNNVNAYRDPYLNTLSYQAGTVTYSNGDGSLVYPGYYPAYGLNVQGAGPVGSLRMEALRDGLEDYEYVKQIRAGKGRYYANLAVSKIIGGKRTIYVRGRPTFPSYSKGAYRYEVNHRAMAATIMQ